MPALERATGEILVFTDAGHHARARVARARSSAHFADPAVGCVSGEDYVEGGGSEGLYGRIELLLRREEALAAFHRRRQRLLLRAAPRAVPPFISGMAPDFLSVLNVVRAGSRALAEPRRAAR